MARAVGQAPEFHNKEASDGMRALILANVPQGRRVVLLPREGMTRRGIEDAFSWLVTGNPDLLQQAALED